MTTLEKAKAILEKINAKDIAVYEFKEKSPFYDYFIVGTVNERAGNAAISYFNSELQSEIKHVEGKKNTSWVLIDLGDVVVHLFSESDREFYGFDKRFMEIKKR
ncbi:ribosome-associated protein [Acholeplasma oculi]|uniref:Ribosomal silencing factor RsfS n=1 Tax=Acholeplasma oculi TaxID=35623 RepID=A0A061AHL3_9MOLU|nr:ribosome silencing factor [Acholeplasma oculi]CDR31096.1 Ribosomal silencing factor RsfS [Acholeplasma oculi]SKC37003.1 ribosome-associated protein [Acholeplasma oculi]SUT90771.1 ribosome-associated protein [Acholeplasma oculi]